MSNLTSLDAKKQVKDQIKAYVNSQSIKSLQEQFIDSENDWSDSESTSVGEKRDNISSHIYQVYGIKKKQKTS